MATLTEILDVNWIVLYFIYGQVFFVTGLVTGLQWQRRSDLELARPLPWLAAFGIAHGLNEWGHIFIPLQALYLSNQVVRFMAIAHLLLLAVSFFFLLQFGIEMVIPLIPRQRWLHALPTAMLVLWGSAVFLRGALFQDPLVELLAIGDAWSRYLLCLPGSILASVGLFRQARHMRQMNLPDIALYLTGAGTSFVIYALVGGLIVPAAPVFLADQINYDLLARTIQIPAPVFRSICGLAMAFFVTRSLDVFQVETDRQLAEMEQTQVLVEDRERIGRELHDGIVQDIYAAGLGLEEARHLVTEDPSRARQQIGAIMSSLDQTIQDIRRYIFDLRAAEQGRELERILENLVQNLRMDTLLEVDLEVKGHRCCWLDGEQISHFTQIAREGLSNVVQHANAHHVTVGLEYAGNLTSLTIRDDGRGVDLSTLENGHPHGQGIDNMQARARMLGGDLILRSEPGQGMQLVLVLPCDDKTNDEPEPEVVEL